MKFKGTSLKRCNAAQAEWERWCKRMRLQSPHLLEVAERWVRLMEQRAQENHTQVRNMAESTLQEAGGSKLMGAEIRRIILILRDTWYLGQSLAHWGVDEKYLKRDEVRR